MIFLILARIRQGECFQRSNNGSTILLYFVKNMTHCAARRGFNSKCSKMRGNVNYFGGERDDIINKHTN